MTKDGISILHPVSFKRWMALDMIRTHPRKPPPSFLWIFLWFQTLMVMASDLPIYLQDSKHKQWLDIWAGAIFHRDSYRSKCWFHLGSNEDLQVSVLWHWPDPSTLTLANGSGKRNRSFFARFLAHSTEWFMEEKKEINISKRLVVLRLVILDY